MTQPATFGGPGFRHRDRPHTADVAAGEPWSRVGTCDEYTQLQDALLVWPPDTIDQVVSPDAWLMLDRPDVTAMRAQLDALATTFDHLGVHVHIHHELDAPPNAIFARDLVFTTPDGCAVARPASPVRAGEAPVAQRALAALNVPILGVPRDTATFEGADALWLDADTLLVGVGTRTNQQGADFVRGLVGPDVVVHEVSLPPGTQHLLGVVLRLDHNLAAVDAERAPPSLRRLLAAHGIHTIELPPTAELRAGRGMNGVCVAPRVVVVPGGCHDIRLALEAHDVEVHPVDVRAFLVAGGAMGCMTAPLRRAGQPSA